MSTSIYFENLYSRMIDAKKQHSFDGMVQLYTDYFQNKLQDDSALKIEPRVQQDTTLLHKIQILYAEALSKTGQLDEALEIVGKLLQEYTEDSIKEHTAEAFFIRGEILTSSSEYELAKQDFQRALQLFKSNSNFIREGQTLEKLGVLSFYLSDYQGSLEFTLPALAMFEQINLDGSVASCLGNIGNCYWAMSKYDEALSLYKRALEINERLGYKRGIASNLSNLGNVSALTADYTSAIEYYQKAIAINTETQNKNSLALSYGNLANTYALIGEFVDSIEMYNKALALTEEMNNAHDSGNWLGNIGIVYQDLGEFDHALEFYKQAIKKYEQVGDIDGIAIWIMNCGIICALQQDYTQSLRYIEQALESFRKIGNGNGEGSALCHIGSVHLELGNYDESLRISREALQLAKEIGDRHTEVICLSTIGTALSKTTTKNTNEEAKDFLMSALELAQSLDMKKELYEIHHAVSKMYRREGLIDKAFEHFVEYHTLEKQLLHGEVQKKVKQLDAERRFNASEKLRIEADHQREVTDKILHNILPSSIADRLKNGEQVIADSSENVTVLFADIVGFTKLSAKVSAEQLVRMLNDVFLLFDELAEKYGLEKIKTIGDCYMVVGGLPEKRDDHAQAVVKMGLDMASNLHTIPLAKEANLNIRIGIHTGGVVAGVIGKRKFAYDIWGDTVNTASRMESHGEAGKVHVSNEVYKLIKADFILIDRGEIEVKGKGKMQTWFVDNSPELCASLSAR